MLANTELLKYLGFSSQGDLGPWTFYTGRRNQLVWFVKSPPLEPPSQLQTTCRNRFRLNGYLWRKLSHEHQSNWETASKRAHLRINGHNLFTFWNLTKDDAAIRTVERLSNLNLIPLQFPT